MAEHLERAQAEYRRVQQRDWDHPEPAEWLQALDRAVRAEPGEVVLVGHSFGCLAIAKWAAGKAYGDWEFEVRDPNGYVLVEGGA